MRQAASIVGFALLVLACKSEGQTCGPGTHSEEGVCVPDIVGGDDTQDTDTQDTDTQDTDTQVDSGTDTQVDTAQGSSTWDIYILTGQSNMVGLGQVNALPPSLRLAQSDVQIFSTGAGKWRANQPSSDYSDGWNEYFGPEVTLGRSLADAMPGQSIALIKHAVGGTALYDFWYPGADATDVEEFGEGYQGLRNTISLALAELDASGQDYRMAGVVWMQGESDAVYAYMAESYEDNLSHFISRLREDLATPELPLVVGLIDCLGLCAYRTQVREAQQAVADSSDTISVIETEDLGTYPDDGWHYQGLGMRVMGQRFAEAFLGHSQSALPTPAIELTGAYTYDYTGYFTVGYSFELHTPVEVTDLGIFDLLGDGLGDESQVGLWDEDTASLLLVAEMPAQGLQDTTLYKGFRYVGVEPTRLEPGNYVIGNTTVWGDANYYVYNAGYLSDTSVSWKVGLHAEGSVLEFPNYEFSGTDTVGHWFGPNLLFQSELPF